MKIRNLLATAVLACGALTAAAPASAVIITSPADDFTVNWDLVIGGGVTVRASALFDITSVSSTQIGMTVTTNNLADLGAAAGWTGGWASIGWGFTPNATSGTLTPGDDFDSGIFASIPSLSQVEVCIYAGNNCNGGGQGSLLADGASDSFSLNLSAPSNPSNFWVFDFFGAKFQTGLGSFEFYGCVSGQNCNPPTNVPEPATLGLLGLGLLGMGLANRRKRKAS
jgi:hypothetical protein